MDSKDGHRDYIGIRKGLADGQSLGELEAKILDVIWDLEPPVTTTQVFKIMYPQYEFSYSTIMLTMAKLARKGLLKQIRTGPKKTDAFVYTPLKSRAEVGRELMESVCQTLLKKPLVEVMKAIAEE